MLAYKALDENGLSTYQKYKWPLPKDGKPGKWVKINDYPKLCVRGFHAWKTLERAKEEGTFVYEMEIEGDIVADHEKVAGSRARLTKLLWKWEPEVVETGLRLCLTCGETHDAVIVRKGLAPQWTKNGHSYNPEPWEVYVARLMPNDRIMGYRAAKQNLRKDHRVIGIPVVPAVHGPFKPWENDRCGTCGLNKGLHEGWEERKKIADEFAAYDRWELLLVIQQMREENASQYKSQGS